MPTQAATGFSTQADTAFAGLGGGEAAAVLLFDCVCRGMILDGQFGREIEAVRAAIPA